MNRFLWAAGGDKRRLRLAALCQFVLPGPPILYYGTEIGLSQERDVRQGSLGLPEESRLPMLWGSEMDLMLLADYQALTGLRKDLRVLQEAGMRVLMADDNSLLFQRGECAKAVCVALNLSEQPRLIPLPAGFEQVRLAMGTWDMKINGSGDALLELGGLAGVVLVQAG
jgi:cyclomaltodextrinase